MTIEEFRNAIPTMKELYLIFSKLTHMPYLECNVDTNADEVFAFTDAKVAQTTAKTMQDNFGKPVLIVKVENKDMLKMFGSLNYAGISSLCLVDNGAETHIPMTSIVRQKPIDNVPAEKKPLLNKEVQLNLMYYLQERRNKDGQKADEEIIKGLEHELLVSIRKAKYYLLYQLDEQSQEAPQRLHLVFLKNKDTNKGILPIFTDFGEIDRFTKKQGLRFSILTLDQIAGLQLPDEVEGVLLNPATTAFSMNKVFLSGLVKMPLEENDTAKN